MDDLDEQTYDNDLLPYISTNIFSLVADLSRNESILPSWCMFGKCGKCHPVDQVSSASSGTESTYGVTGLSRSMALKVLPRGQAEDNVFHPPTCQVNSGICTPY